MAVRRYDTEKLDGPKLLPNGWLRADAYIARTGILEYRRGDGSIRRELRRPDQVFRDDALSSFAMVPVTDDHPADGLLTAENTSRYQRGHLGDAVRADGEKVRATVLVTDAALVRKILDGKQELSCGYLCDLDETPGEHQGQRYDAVQLNIRGNHVAVVAAGRAGHDVRLKLDSADGVSIREPRQPADPAPTSQETNPMVKIRIDGVEYEVTEQVAQAIARQSEKTDAALAELGKQEKAAKDALAAQTARADVAEAKAKDAEKARADAADPKRVADAVRARVALERQAVEVLGAEAKLDGLDDRAVKAQVLGKLTPEIKLDGKDAAYVDAAFEIAIATASKDALARTRQAAAPAAGQPGQRLDAAAERERFISETEGAWKTPSAKPAA